MVKLVKFVLGIVRPRIYLPFRLEQNNMEYVQQTDTEPEDRVEIRTQNVSDFIGTHLGAEGTEANTYQVQFPAHS